MLLVVVEDLLDALDTRVLLADELFVLVLRTSLVPVQDTADEGRDQSDTGLSASDGLAETEEEGEVAVDLLVTLELAGGLDAFPCRGDFDEDALLGDAVLLVELDELTGLVKYVQK